MYIYKYRNIEMSVSTQDQTMSKKNADLHVAKGFFFSLACRYAATFFHSFVFSCYKTHQFSTLTRKSPFQW